MKFLASDLKKGSWIRLSDPVLLVLCSIECNDDDTIRFRLIPVSEFKCSQGDNGFPNLENLSIARLVLTDKKAIMYEAHTFNYNEISPDVVVGFIPHPKAAHDVNINISLMPKDQSEAKAKAKGKFVSWNVRVSANTKYTPFLYGIYPFPRICFWHYKVQIRCESHEFKPTVLLANLDCHERSVAQLSNIYLPNGVLLCPDLRTPYHKAYPKMHLEDISAYAKIS